MGVFPVVALNDGGLGEICDEFQMKATWIGAGDDQILLIFFDPEISLPFVEILHHGGLPLSKPEALDVLHLLHEILPYIK